MSINFRGRFWLLVLAVGTVLTLGTACSSGGGTVASDPSTSAPASGAPGSAGPSASSSPVPAAPTARQCASTKSVMVTVSTTAGTDDATAQLATIAGLKWYDTVVYTGQAVSVADLTKW